jgi:hypothetical protein
VLSLAFLSSLLDQCTLSNKNSRILVWDHLAHTSKTDSVSSGSTNDSRWGSAPLSINNFTMSRWPCLQATYNGLSFYILKLFIKCEGFVMSYMCLFGSNSSILSIL